MINAVNATNGITKQIRLQRIFQKGFFYPQKAYDTISRIGQDEFVGNLPAEMFAKIKSSKTDIPSTILKIKNGFHSAARLLAPFTEIETQTIIKRSKDPKYMREFIDLLKEHPYAKITIRDLDKDRKVVSSIKKAEKTIQKAFKGILPSGSKVQMQYLDSGSFSNGFKVSFLDKDGNKVFDDYVLKAYKDKTTKARNDAINIFIIRHVFESMDDKDLVTFIRNTHKGEKCKKDTLESLVKYEFLQIRKACEEIRKVTPEDLLKEATEQASSSNLHGDLPECNAMTFIRKFAGHKLGTKDNIVLPDFFGLGDASFSLAKFVDKNGERPTRKLDLINLGIISTDTTELNKDNVINGRIIDIGGMMHSYTGDLKDKTTLKYFKKIMNRPTSQRDAFISRYTQEAEKTKDLTLREKIMQAIDAARIYVMSDKHDKMIKQQHNF